MDKLEDLLTVEAWADWKRHPVTKALRQHLEEEHRNLSVALLDGQLLGKTNDRLTQDYASICGRIAQIGGVLTLDRETLIDLIAEEEEYVEPITIH